MDFYVEDCIDDFVEVCETIELPSEDIKRVLNLPTTASPRTWKNVTCRLHADVISNWLCKELSRSGAEGRDSDRRIDLYKDRRNMLNYKDFKKLRQSAPKICPATGHPINYGLGVTKAIYEEYFLKKYGKNGISPSIERMDASGTYEIENVELISSAENVIRNMNVDTENLRKIQSMIQDFNLTVPKQIQVERLLQIDKCELEFDKLDGTKRFMNATQNLDMIPKNHHPASNSRKFPTHIITVWDLDKQAWRSFSYHRLTKFKV